MNSFPLVTTVKKIISQLKSHDENLVLINKISLPKELRVAGSVQEFKKIIWEILLKAHFSYASASNKIILLTAKFESDKKISISFTDGGKSVRKLSLKESSNSKNIYELSRAIKNEFFGKIEIIAGHKTGKTIKCHFPLDL